ncbi:MAG: hypothetical protein AB7E37_08245 [Candidatus Altimarinota bacterium]
MKSFEALVQEARGEQIDRIVEIENEIEREIKNLIIMITERKMLNLDEDYLIEEKRELINSMIKDVEKENAIKNLLTDIDKRKNDFLLEEQNRKIHSKLW